MTNGDRKHTNGSTDVPKKTRCAFAHCPLADKKDPRCGECTGPVQWKDDKGKIHGVRRSCTNCAMNGKHLDVCIVCPGPNTAFASDGQSIVTLGSFADPSGFIEANIEDRFLVSARNDTSFETKHEESADYVVNIPPQAEDYLLQLLRTIAVLRKPQLIALHGALNGMSQSETARATGVKKQAINIAISLMCEAVPELREFFCKPKPKRVNTLHSVSPTRNPIGNIPDSPNDSIDFESPYHEDAEDGE